MKSRPYFNSSVADLERLFDERRDDRTFLETLVNELKFRETQRAKALLGRAVSSLGTLPKSKAAGPAKPERPKAPMQPPPTVGEASAATASSKPVQPPNPYASAKAGEFSTSPELDEPELEARPNKRIPTVRIPVSNHADSVLSAWTAMEVLSPPTFRRPEDLVGGERLRVASIVDKPLPWENGGERSRPNQRLYYQIVLGTVDMEEAVGALLAAYADTRAERPAASGEAVLATVMVDREGKLVESEAVAISSFGWGVPVALSGDLGDLKRWPDEERGLLEGLLAKLSIPDAEGNPLPLTRDAIQGGYEWLARRIRLGSKFIKPPSIVLRSYQYYKFPDPPEAVLLNSFFLGDLAKATTLVGGGHAPHTLDRYLQIAKPRHRKNLMSDRAALTEAMQPKFFPAASWPAPGRHPLALLQQCAVNLALRDLEHEGLLAVNGPPGTGKTTLLRDVIAGIVTRRAEAMIRYDDPEAAFQNSGQRIKKGQTFVHLYRVNEALRGYEVVVASSNNKAVENVSAELPGIEAVADGLADPGYFKSVSDNVLGRETWGMVAAVLGNARNRSEFRQKFWWDEELGMHRFFQQASGNPQLIVEKAEDGTTTQRIPKIIAAEKPPSDHEEAVKRYKTARSRFRKVNAEVKVKLASLQKASDLYTSIPKLEAEIEHLPRMLQANLAAAQLTALEADRAQSAVSSAAARTEITTRRLQGEMAKRPGLLSRFLNNAAARDWQTTNDALRAELSSARAQLATAEQEAASRNAAHSRSAAAYREMETSLADKRAALDQEREHLRSLQHEFSGKFLSPDFFELGHADRQKTSPWLDVETARLRNDLFEAAMAVHKAFAAAAAKPIRHNLNILMDGFGTRSLGTPERDALIPHLWSTLFLVVPAVSTTFASVARMFAKIGPGEFGWLLVDEAGQALPQAAVGAVMRTKRTVVVGDPIQIEPVVILPDQLTDAICLRFGVEPLTFNPPTASAQTLADSATEYFGTFETFGTREVGVPLLVHRRCSDPMFTISNSIAYENLMVQAKPQMQSTIRDCLGQSRWIDVEGRGQDKWCQAEGEVVLDCLRRLRASGCAPDIYIVTPFVVVQDRLRELLRRDGLLEGWMSDPYNWVRERIGTVHTVQGREAEAVIFVLGAPEAAQRGARGWAGGRPNLLNVAVTRAKEAVYVVGNRELWKSAGVFQMLDRLL
jgi:energy-coupling factor transporter ATP-binding protein EcfA2